MLCGVRVHLLCGVRVCGVRGEGVPLLPVQTTRFVWCRFVQKQVQFIFHTPVTDCMRPAFWGVYVFYVYIV